MTEHILQYVVYLGVYFMNSNPDCIITHYEKNIVLFCKGDVNIICFEILTINAYTDVICMININTNHCTHIYNIFTSDILFFINTSFNINT